MRNLALSIPGTGSVPGYTVQPPAGIPGNTAYTTVLQNIVILLIGLAILLAFIFLIFAGIQWITSGGDKQKIAAARRRITFTVVGLIVVSLAFMIINLVASIFGVTLLSH